MAVDSRAADPQRRIDPNAVRLALNHLASAPSAPWLHGEIARRLGERLDIIVDKPLTIVDWWSFGGASDAVLAAACPGARRWRVEPTLELRRRHASARAWRQWLPWTGRDGDALEEADVAAASAQLLWSNMMLHAAADPLEVIGRWHRAVMPGGFILFSCLGPDTLKELRALYGRMGWPPCAQEFVDMHDLGDMLLERGFADPVMDQETITLTWSDAAAMLAELRTLGRNAAPGRFAGARTPRWRRQLSEQLAADAPGNGRIAMTFEIVYGHAFKPRAATAQAGETRVSFDDMRAMARGPRKRHRTIP